MYSAREPGSTLMVGQKRENSSLSESYIDLKWKFGGARRDRTADLLTASQTLSQLSYSPTCGESGEY